MEACRKMSSECGKALTELSSAIQTMTKPKAIGHVAGSRTAAANLKTALKTTSSDITALLEILPAVTIASLLIEIVDHTEKLMVAVGELGHLAKFKNPASVAERTPSLHRGAVKPLSDDVVTGIPGLETSTPENACSQEPMRSRHVDM